MVATPPHPEKAVKKKTKRAAKGLRAAYQSALAALPVCRR
jgi:hypothetical protein